MVVVGLVGREGVGGEVCERFWVWWWFRMSFLSCVMEGGEGGRSGKEKK